MNWKCPNPNCNYQGSGFSLFDGFGESLRGDYRCPKCLCVLQTSLQCPRGHIVKGHHETLDRIVPFVHLFKALTGTKKSVCPECGIAYPFPLAFKVVLSFGDKTTVNNP
ncbi:MAG: hypothetical protein AB1746_09455 [Candidatus Zixiibacteriota bacterium]